MRQTSQTNPAVVMQENKNATTPSAICQLVGSVILYIPFLLAVKLQLLQRVRLAETLVEEDYLYPNYHFNGTILIRHL